MKEASLEQRIATALAGVPTTQRRMFGGLCFMLNGNMVAGTLRNELLVRVGKDGNDAALARPHARPMDHGGRQVAGYLIIANEGTAHDRDLKAWLDLAVAHVTTLPPKHKVAPKPAKMRRSR